MKKPLNRDKVAIEAMGALLRHFDFSTFKQDPARLAGWAYDMADEMEKERKRRYAREREE